MKIISKIKDFFNPYAKTPSAWDDYWYRIPFGLQEETNSGSRIDEITALNLTGVWACVNAISQDIASLPLHLYVTDTNGSKQKAETRTFHKSTDSFRRSIKVP